MTDIEIPKFAINVSLTKKDWKDLDAFALEIVKAKSKEMEYASDHGAMAIRYVTGMSGEWAVRKWLKLPKPDLSVGHSSKYAVPDLHPHYDLGVKSVRMGRYPIIKREPKSAQVIVIRDDGVFTICGIADIECQMKYQSDEMVSDKRILYRGTKTAFTGISNLTDPKEVGRWKLDVKGVEK